MASERVYTFEEGADLRSRRLLSPVVENGLRDGVRRIVGCLLLASVACGWLALLSWSLRDPSLSNGTALTARNLLGSTGAIAADVFLQMFGLAAVLLLLAPMLWGATLVQHEPVHRLGRRFGSYVAAVPLFAGAMAALPAPASWPLHPGLGGIIGDALMHLASIPLVLVHADAARPVAAVVLLALALWTASISVGWHRAARGADQTRRPTYRTTRTSAQHPITERVQPSLSRNEHPPAAAPFGSASSHVASQTAYFAPFSDEGPATAPAAGLGTEYDDQVLPSEARSAGHRSPQRFGPYADISAEPEPNSGDSDGAFDIWTEAASSGIASRFAPSTNGPQALQATLLDAFSAQAPLSNAPARADSSSAVVVSTGRAVAKPAVKRQPYRRPSLNLLEQPLNGRARPGPAESLLRGNARLLEDVLADFGVVGQISDIRPGPVVTLYELEPARGTKAARVIGLADEIARQMGVQAVRISTIQGRTALGIELPNPLRETVYLRDLFDAEAYRSSMDQLPIALGKTITGEAVVADLSRMPHMLVAGTTGSGKSVGINAMILSLLYRHGPDDCRFLMIDPKMLELSVYEGIPHLLTPVVTDPHKAITALSWCVTEMEERYKRMAALGVRNIDVFNNRVRHAQKRGEPLHRTVQTGFDSQTGEATFVKEPIALDVMPYIVIVIDEFADLMAVAGKEIEGAVQRLAQAARAAGIHLIMATQRPTADIVTGGIKANMPARVSYKVASKIDSRVILGGEGAEQLLGAGDMLYANGGGQTLRVHGAYVSDEEVENVTVSLREQGAPRYVEGITGSAEEAASGEALVRTSVASRRPQVPGIKAASDDALYDRAVAIVARDQTTSIAHIQRRLNISPAWAAGLLERLQADGIITPPEADGTCRALVGRAA